MSAQSAPEKLIADVICPFCGLLCDDLVVARQPGEMLEVREHGCPISRREFAREAGDPSPRVHGARASLEDAVEEAAAILRAARAPLFGGLATDLAGVRATLRLAERLGAAVDHARSPGLARNGAVVSRTGWFTTTLAEARNRADLVVLAGGGAAGAYPRLAERVLWPAEALFTPVETRAVVVLGEAGEWAGVPGGRAPESLPCEPRALAEVFGALRCLCAGRGLDHGQPGGVPIARLRELADRLRAARYAVIAWDAGRLDFPHADLAVEAICGLIEDLNSGTRCAGLPLGGSDGASTWLQAATWQTGFPGRVSFAGGYPAHDPYRLDARRLLASGEADALVWISAFDAGLVPPPTDCPTVVLGRNGMTPEREPEVLVPVGTPGLDHTGHAFRFDGVATLPLAALRTGPAAVAEVLERIERVV